MLVLNGKICTKCDDYKYLMSDFYTCRPKGKPAYLYSFCKDCHNKMVNKNRHKWDGENHTDRTSKVCTKCNTEKCLLAFYKDSQQKDGRTSRCKACAEEHKQKVGKWGGGNFTNRTHKICSACNLDKKLDEYYRDSHSKDGRKSICIECAHIKNPPKTERKAQRRNDSTYKKVGVYHKICKVCRFDKDIFEFGLRADNRDGRQTKCKKCVWKINNPGKETRRKFRVKTVEVFQEYTEHKICLRCKRPFTVQRCFKNRNAVITRCCKCREVRPLKYITEQGGPKPGRVKFSNSGKQSPTGVEVLDIRDVLTDRDFDELEKVVGTLELNEDTWN